MDPREADYELDSTGSGYGFCEHGYELPSYIKAGHFLIR
jgi:hypothetical protein